MEKRGLIAVGAVAGTVITGFAADIATERLPYNFIEVEDPFTRVCAAAGFGALGLSRVAVALLSIRHLDSN